MKAASYTLLLVIALCVSSIMMCSGLMLILGGLLPFLLYWIRSTALGVFCYIMILLFIALLLQNVTAARETARCVQCKNNLKQLALSVLSYQQHYNSLPPVAVFADNGKPMHSWRVLVLPFIEQEELIDEYDYNESWDGPNNIKLLGQRPWCYSCWSDGVAYYGGENTSYIAFIGPKTIWSGKYSAFFNINSIMLVETVGSDIKWTEPRDISVPINNAGKDKPTQPTIASRHAISPGFFWHDIPALNAAFRDGSVATLPAAIFTDNNISNSINVDDESIALWIAEHRRIHWPHLIGLAVWIVSLVLLIHWSIRCRKVARRKNAEVNTAPGGTGGG